MSRKRERYSAALNEWQTACAQGLVQCKTVRLHTDPDGPAGHVTITCDDGEPCDPASGPTRDIILTYLGRRYRVIDEHGLECVTVGARLRPPLDTARMARDMLDDLGWPQRGY